MAAYIKASVVLENGDEFELSVRDFNNIRRCLLAANAGITSGDGLKTRRTINQIIQKLEELSHKPAAPRRKKPTTPKN